MFVVFRSYEAPHQTLLSFLFSHFVCVLYLSFVLHLPFDGRGRVRGEWRRARTLKLTASLSTSVAETRVR